MIYKAQPQYFPCSPRIVDGQVVTGLQQLGAYYQSDKHTFPEAYLVQDSGPYLDNPNQRAEFAHYHPLAHS